MPYSKLTFVAKHAIAFLWRVVHQLGPVSLDIAGSYEEIQRGRGERRKVRKVSATHCLEHTGSEMGNSGPRLLTQEAGPAGPAPAIVALQARGRDLSAQAHLAQPHDISFRSQNSEATLRQLTTQIF